MADTLRVGMVCAAAAFLILGEEALGVKALLVLAAAAAARWLAPHPGFDLTFTLALSGELVGTTLGAYGAVGWSDTVSHIALPFLSAPIVYGALIRLRAVTGQLRWEGLHRPAGAALYTAGAVLVVGFAWEIIEWASDATLTTDFSQGRTDTLFDLRNDGIAAMAAGALLGGWLRWFGTAA